jgi:Uma2 family endonuclease
MSDSSATTLLANRSPSTPPLLCIEMLSPEDRLPGVLKVLGDFATMGVPNLWILDPTERIAYSYKDSKDSALRLITDRLTIPDTETTSTSPPSSPNSTNQPPI